MRNIATSWPPLRTSKGGGIELDNGSSGQQKEGDSARAEAGGIKEKALFPTASRLKFLSSRIASDPQAKRISLAGLISPPLAFLSFFLSFLSPSLPFFSVFLLSSLSLSLLRFHSFQAASLVRVAIMFIAVVAT